MIISEGFSGINGVEFIEQAYDKGEAEYDIAFIDMNMPFMDGI